MERIMIICGGKHQIPLIQKAKEMGYDVVNTNLYPDSPAFPYADITGQIDVLNQKENFTFAKKQNVIAVISDQSEISVRTVAEVAQKLCLQSIGSDVANLFTNKYLMREFCKKKGYTYPRYIQCNCEAQAICFFEENNEKMIIKPPDANSSKGVYSIGCKKDIIEKFCETQKYSDNVVMEEYIEGTEFTIDAVVVEGHAYNLAISEKKHFSYNENVACELFFSYENEEYDYDELRQLNKAILEDSGLKFGLTHSEYKYSGKEFVLIEMAARGGGAYIASKIVPFLSGVDNYKYYIQSAIGKLDEDYEKNIRLSIQKNQKRVAKLKFMDIKQYGKRVKRISGIESICRNESVIHFELAFQVGDILEKAENDSSRQGYYIVGGENVKEIEQAEQYVLETLQIEFE